MKIHHTSFFYFHTLLISLFVFPLSIRADDIKVKTTISAVTVYTDQVLVTRTAKENIAAGTQKIIISDLPWGMVDQSLKVSGTSDHEVKISDIKIEQIFLDTIPPSRSDDLYGKLYDLKQEKNLLERSNMLYKSQFDAIDAMKESYTKSLALQNPGQKASVEEWDKLLQFVEKKKSEYSDKMELTRKKIEYTVNRINAIQEELKAIGGAGKKQMKQVSVTVNTYVTGSVKFEISYIVYTALWIPTYEVRATSADKSLQLVYSGNVKQSSSEDWNNVDLTLSTARPAASEILPALTQWTLDVQSSYLRTQQRRNTAQSEPGRANTEITFTGNTISGKVVDRQNGEPLVGASIVVKGTSYGGTTNVDGDYVVYNVPSGMYSVQATVVGYQPVVATGVSISNSKGAQQTFDMSQSDIIAQEVVITAQRAQIQEGVLTSSVSVRGSGTTETNYLVGLEESSSTSQITSSTFSIPSKQTIPSDNQNHKVGISIVSIPVSFIYTVVPKQSQAAFLVGKGKNPNDYPLMAGEANVFLDDAFISSMRINTIMPNDSFLVNLGVDEGIRVSRKLVSRFKESVGTFSTKQKITFEYENTAENHKKYPVDIVLYDQVPVSRDEKIVVETLDPDTKIKSPDMDGTYTWNITLKEGEKKTVKIKFSVEFPPGITPFGL
jgi:hypothetical protein